jgi:hypothetical protein
MMLRPSPLRHAIARLGVPGLTAGVLLAFSAWGEWMEVPQIEKATADMEQRRANLVARQAGVDARLRPAQALAAVHATLTPRAQSNDAIAIVLEQARVNGLAVDTVQYRNTSDPLAGVERHEIEIPVKGRYEAIRAWLAGTLAEQRSLSLDTLALRRPDARQDVVEAHVGMSLWVRGDEPVVAAQSPSPARRRP